MCLSYLEPFLAHSRLSTNVRGSELRRSQEEETSVIRGKGRKTGISGRLIQRTDKRAV